MSDDNRDANTRTHLQMIARFTDQKPRTATEVDLKMNWSGGGKGERFRCYLCGYKFKVGDTWRWIYMGDINCVNVITCKDCDTPDVKEKWKSICTEFYTSPRFWALRPRRT